MAKRALLIGFVLCILIVPLLAVSKSESELISFEVYPKEISKFCEIYLQTSEPLPARIEVFSPEGELVSLLFEGVWPLKQVLYWDRTDDWGEYCPAGAYTIQATVFVNFRYTSTKKTVILK